MCERPRNKKEEGATLLLELEPCLICSSPKTIPISSAAPFENTCLQDNNSSVNSSLSVLFLLRELLEFPSENCEGILVETGGLNPCQWFAVCSHCSELVREAFTIHFQILELETQLGKLKKEVSKKMKESFLFNQEEEEENCGGEEGIFCPRKDIREFYGAKHNHPPQTPKEEVESVDPLELNFEDNWANSVPLSGCDNGEAEEDDLSFVPEYNVVPNSPLLDETSSQLQLQDSSPEPSSSGSKSSRGKYGKRRKYKCPSCPLTFFKQTVCKLHTLLRHTFPDLQEPEREDSDESLETGLPLSCILCNCNYSTIDRMIRHLEHHMRFKRTTCNICKYPADSKRKLEYHYKVVHKGIRETGRENSDNEEDKHEDDELDPAFNPEDEDIPPKCRKSQLRKKRISRKTSLPKNDRTLNLGPTRNRKYECPSCPSSFQKKSILKLHILLRHTFDIPEVEKEKQDSDESLEISPYSCILCDRQYSHLDGIIHHLENHVRFRKTSCPICKYPLESQSKLNDHHKRLHNESMPRISKCQITSSYFYKCQKDDCDFECNHPRYKFRHIQSHKFSDNLVEVRPQEFHCKLCPSQFKLKTEITIHLRSEHGKELDLSPPQKCPQCGRLFHDISKMKDHLNQVHLKKYRHTSSRQKKEAKDLKEEKEAELRRESCLELGKTWCVHCQVQVGVSDMRYHLRKEHSDLYKFSCDLCGEMYQGLTALNSHRNQIHSELGKKKSKRHLRRGKLSNYYEQNREESDFSCNLCVEKFKTRKKVCKHLLANHSREMKVRMSQCHICGEMYSDSSQVKYHITTAHKKEFNLYCEECGQGFMRKTLLEEHLEKHAMKVDVSEKIFECELCEKKFASRKARHTHNWRSHGVRIAK